MYPRIIINLSHITENVKTVVRLCAEHGIRLVGVTKVFRGDAKIAQSYLDGGLEMLGDSRIGNLSKLAGLSAEKWLIRPPMLSETADLVRYADASLNSELVTIQAIDREAGRCGKTHKIILMVDLGDIREGYTDYDELLEVAKQVERMKNTELYGIGTNLTCFSFVQSDELKMQTLADLRRRVEETIGRPLGIVSGGNSAAIDLMLRGGIVSEIDSLRLGESLLFGKERAKYTYLPGTYKDTFTLECEIVELKEKPSLPWGEIGVDSYGNRPKFTDRGIRQKAVCALGKQDFDPETSVPLDAGIKILGASSDHLMLDVTESEKEYRVGDIIGLQLGYFSTMRAFTSAYVEKIYIK